MISLEQAATLVAASPLFDEEWYAGLTGLAFGSRRDAVEHWVGQTAPDASPHPLVEPAWLFPRAGWRQHAPDPLSHYLSREQLQQRRSPHPRYPIGRLGPLTDWLGTHDPAELLPDPIERAPVAEALVRVPVDDVAVGVPWARQLAKRTPEVTGILSTADPAARRILASVVADLPSIRVTGPDDASAPRAPVEIDVPAGQEAPRWDWIPQLIAALDVPGVAAAQPLPVDADFCIAAPFLTGHPASTATRLDGASLPQSLDTATARRVDSEGDLVLAATSWLPAETAPTDDAYAGLEQQALSFAPRPQSIDESAPRLRWALDLSAGAGPMGRTWGDWSYAVFVSEALTRLGQWVEIDHPETRSRASRDRLDVTVTLRGLHPITPPSHTTNLLWVISHPDEVTADEAAAYDLCFAAGGQWAADRSAEWGIDVQPLLHSTDATRFHPGLMPEDEGTEVLFVGNSRSVLRPSVAAAIETGVPITVIGAGWDEWLPAANVTWEAKYLPFDQLASRYAAAGLVLNDHWEDMRLQGFVSDRIFDALAVGARVLTDDVAALQDVLGFEVPTWRSYDEFAALATPPFTHHPDAATRREIAGSVIRDHSFDGRAGQLLDAVVHLRSS